MEKVVSMPTIGLLAATRGMLGAGIGLLVADKLEQHHRRTVGWSLAAIGAASTIPLAMRVFGHKDTELVP